MSRLLPILEYSSPRRSFSWIPVKTLNYSILLKRIYQIPLSCSSIQILVRQDWPWICESTRFPTGCWIDQRSHLAGIILQLAVLQRYANPHILLWNQTKPTRSSSMSSLNWIGLSRLAPFVSGWTVSRLNDNRFIHCMPTLTYSESAKCETEGQSIWAYERDTHTHGRQTATSQHPTTLYKKVQSAGTVWCRGGSVYQGGNVFVCPTRSVYTDNSSFGCWCSAALKGFVDADKVLTSVSMLDANCGCFLLTPKAHPSSN